MAQVNSTDVRASEAERSPGWGDLLSGANALRSLALAGGVALHAVNVYIATTILPSVVEEIGGLDLYAWNTTLFVVASILGSALSAKLLQRLGPRGAYAVAALVFIVGTIGCAIAPSMPLMLAGRFIQGFGGGFLFALAYAMIRFVFDEALWPRAMALVSGMWGVATLIGPAVGGVFAEAGAWRWAFWSIVPATAVFAAMAYAVLPPRSGDTDERPALPLAQLALLTAAVIAVSAGSVMPGALRNSVGIAVALLLSLLLVAKEKRAKQRLLPRGTFTFTGPLAALYATLSLLAVTVTSTEIFVPLFLQVLHGQSPLIAGYLAALMAAGWTIGSIASSGAGAKGAARAMVAAPVLAFSGMVVLALLMPRGSDGDWIALAPLCVGLAGVGFGVGLGWPHLLTRVLQVAPAGEQDLASASLTTVQLFATAIGAALAGMVANLAGLTHPGGATGAADAAQWLFGVFALAPLAAVVIVRIAGRLQASD